MTTPMRALTVRQPWAWAIIHGGKNIENRCWAPSTIPGHIAIHAGKTDDDLYAFDFVHGTIGGTDLWSTDRSAPFPRGAIVGTVEIVSFHPTLLGRHRCTGRHCEPWGVQGSGWHWVLADPQSCEPIPCRGALGLWRVPDDIAARLDGDL